MPLKKRLLALICAAGLTVSPLQGAQRIAEIPRDIGVSLGNTAGATAVFATQNSWTSGIQAPKLAPLPLSSLPGVLIPPSGAAAESAVAASVGQAATQSAEEASLPPQDGFAPGPGVEQALKDLREEAPGDGRNPQPQNSGEILESAAARYDQLFDLRPKLELASDRLERVSEVLADPSVPDPVKNILLGSNIMATSLGAKPMSWFSADVAPQHLEGLQKALSRISPDLEATRWESGPHALRDHPMLVVYDRSALAGVLKDDERLPRILGTPPSDPEQAGRLLGYPQQDVRDFSARAARGGSQVSISYALDPHRESGLTGIVWRTWHINPLQTQRLRTLYAAVLGMAEERLSGPRIPAPMAAKGGKALASEPGNLSAQREAEKVELVRALLIGALQDPDLRRPLKRLLRAHFPSRPGAAIEAMASALERDAASLEIRFASPEEERLFFKRGDWAHYQRIQTEGSSIQSRILLSRRADVMHAPSILLSAVTLHELAHYTLGLGEHSAHRIQNLFYRHIHRKLKDAGLHPDWTSAQAFYQAGLVDAGLARISEYIRGGRLTSYLLAAYERGYFAATRRPDDRLAFLKFRTRHHQRVAETLKRRMALEASGAWAGMGAAQRRQWESLELRAAADRKLYRRLTQDQSPAAAIRTLESRIADDARSIEAERRRLDGLETEAAPQVPQAMREPILHGSWTSKRKAVRRLGLDPKKQPGTLLNDEDKSSWAEVLRIPWKEGEDLVFKMFHPPGLLAGLWPWNSAVRAASHELFIRLVIEAFFSHALASPKALGYAEGWIRYKGAVVMEAVNAAPDADRLTIMPFTVRAVLAAIALTFGMTDVNPRNILFGPGAVFLIDTERVGAETNPHDSGHYDLAEKPWLIDDSENTLAEPAFAQVIPAWLQTFWKPQTQSALKHMLRKAGIRGKIRKAYMAIFRDNAGRLTQVLEANMLGANLRFRQRVVDAGLDYRMAGVLSEINKAVLSSPNGGAYRDLARFFIARHGLRHPFGLDRAPGKSHVLNPAELAALLRHLRQRPGGILPESDYQAALAQWRLGRWPSPVTEAQLRSAFDQLNQWLLNPPPVPDLPLPSERSKKAA